MIDKIIKIQGIGKYTNYTSSAKTFPENLRKIVAIYADNASGKTTLSSIFKSLGEYSNEAIIRRKCFLPNSPEPYVELLVDNKIVKFKKYRWVPSQIETNSRPFMVEVFDSEYIEKNVYVMTLDKQDDGSIFGIVVGRHSIDLVEEKRNLCEERVRERNRRHRIKRRLKNEDLDEDIRQELGKKQQMSRKRSQEIGDRIKEIDKTLTSSANEFGEEFISIINQHLNIFAPDLKITKLDKRANKFIYYLKVNDVEIRNGSNSISLRRTLSEGEKNALAFSFFLARLSLNQDMSRTIVVFDDPINSFDAKRRNATKNKLLSIARRSLQFFLLSHDIKFVRDFSEALPSNEILNLKISFDGKTSYLKKHDIKTDTLTGFFKDLRILHDYVKSQDCSDVRPIDVARCLRPVLEGMFRIKYFDRFSENMWLGDMLKEIRDCDPTCVLAKQKSNYEELTDINDYSAPFHHESPAYMSVEINSGELLSYCRRVIKLIEII